MTSMRKTLAIGSKGQVARIVYQPLSERLIMEKLFCWIDARPRRRLALRLIIYSLLLWLTMYLYICWLRIFLMVRAGDLVRASFMRGSP